MKKISILALMFLASLAMPFFMTSVYAESDIEVYRNVSYQVGVEEIVGEPFVVYYGTGTVIVSYKDGLKLRLIVNGRYPLTNGSRVIELEPKEWRIVENGNCITTGPDGCWFYYTPTNVTWRGNGKPLREEGRYMDFAMRFEGLGNPSISIWTYPANGPHYNCC